MFLHDGAVCTIRTQQLYDSAIEYYIKPTEIDLVKSDYPVHRAWPKIGWKKDMQHGIVPENELFGDPFVQVTTLVFCRISNAERADRSQANSQW